MAGGVRYGDVVVDRAEVSVVMLERGSRADGIERKLGLEVALGRQEGAGRDIRRRRILGESLHVVLEIHAVVIQAIVVLRLETAHRVVMVVDVVKTVLLKLLQLPVLGRKLLSLCVATLRTLLERLMIFLSLLLFLVGVLLVLLRLLLCVLAGLGSSGGLSPLRTAIVAVGEVLDVAHGASAGERRGGEVLLALGTLSLALGAGRSGSGNSGGGGSGRGSWTRRRSDSLRTTERAGRRSRGSGCLARREGRVQKNILRRDGLGDAPRNLALRITGQSDLRRLRRAKERVVGVHRDVCEIH